MRVLLLSAGRGERLRPLTDHTPKPLMEVAGDTLLGHHLSRLAAAGFRQVVVNTAHLAEQIHEYLGDGSRWGLDVRVSYEGTEPLETGGGMFNALPLLGPDPFLAVNADIVTDFPFVRLPAEPTGQAHLVMVDKPSWRQSGDFALHRGRLTGRDPSGLTFSGIGVYRPELLAGQRPGKFSIVPLLEAAMAEGRVTGEHYTGMWHDTGTIERLSVARAEFPGG